MGRPLGSKNGIRQEKRPPRTTEQLLRWHKSWRQRHPGVEAKLEMIRRQKRREALIGHPEPEFCELCGGQPTGWHGKLCADHNHITGKGRGWICDNCNLGIDRFHDNPKLLRQAARYLEKYDG